MITNFVLVVTNITVNSVKLTNESRKRFNSALFLAASNIFLPFRRPRFEIDGISAKSTKMFELEINSSSEIICKANAEQNSTRLLLSAERI